MSSEKKVGEALGHIRQAEKCLKTSLLKWNPDLDGAAAEYLKADLLHFHQNLFKDIYFRCVADATCYKNAKALAEARDMYVKAAELHERMKAPFHAAKAYEQAGLISKENKEIELAVQFMERASVMFQEHGTPDTAALCLEKGAKMVAQSHPSKAVDLYKRASEVAEIEDRPRQSAENIGKAGRLLITLKRHDEAIQCLTKEIEYYAQAQNYEMICKIVIGVILLKLTAGDYVSAHQFYSSCMSYPMFSDSEESAAMFDLLQSYDNGDEDNARRVLSLPLIKYMDNSFAKLARDLDIPGGMKIASTERGGVTPEGGTEGGTGGGAPTQLDDDELEGGLC